MPPSAPSELCAKLEACRRRVDAVARYQTAYPFSRNQATALARVSCAGVCGKPSSRTAFDGLKCIVWLDIRIVSGVIRGALG